MQSPLEESVEQRQYGVIDVPKHAAEHDSNLHVLCGSLTERYKRQQVRFHIHLYSGSERPIHDGERPDLCILVEHGSQVNLGPRLPVDLLGDNLMRGYASVQMGEQHTSVLVDVAEMVENGQHVLGRILPVLVRLQAVNLCDGVGCDSVKPMSTALRDERFWCRTDGKHIAVDGFLLRSPYKFPYQIIEGRSEVLDAVPDKHRDTSRDRFIGDDSPDVLIRATFGLSHHFCRVGFVIPTDLGFKFFQVFVSPDDFVAD